MKLMPDALKQMLTEDDANTVYCPVRVFGAVGVAIYHLLTGYMVFAHGAFDAMAYGTGFAAVLGALGAGIGAKAKLGG